MSELLRRAALPGLIALAALLLILASAAWPLALVETGAEHPIGQAAAPGMALAVRLVLGIAALAAWAGLVAPARAQAIAQLILCSASILGALLLAGLPAARGEAAAGAGFWLCAAALALLATTLVARAAAHPSRAVEGAVAVLFGLWVLYFWQVLVGALGVPRVLLPSPLLIAAALVADARVLSSDFVQTVGKAAASGWLLGSGSGFGVALALDRVPFLKRGLLPVAALTSAVPLVGVAPIAVMWFGFDWPSKAAVVALMTFFPMLAATLAGLEAASHQELELMYSYAAGYRRTLWSLRLPTALPFLFAALKVNAALALIGAIVAEFFGSPTAGIGFRISTEAAHMNMALVWAAIVVAAATGSICYALLSRMERVLAFWHPSQRSP